MGRRGPAAKPTKLKELAGNPGRRPLNKNEPQPDATKPRCPSWLGDEAKKEWRRVVTRLHDVGLLTAVDHGVIEAYCVLYGRWVEAELALVGQPLVVKTTNGNPVQNPYLAISNRAIGELLKFAREFGMTPAARARVVVGDDGKQREETLADVLFGGGR